MSQGLYPKCIGRQDTHWGQASSGDVSSGVSKPQEKPEGLLHMRRPAQGHPRAWLHTSGGSGRGRGSSGRGQDASSLACSRQEALGECPV